MILWLLNFIIFFRIILKFIKKNLFFMIRELISMVIVFFLNICSCLNGI